MQSCSPCCPCQSSVIPWTYHSTDATSGPFYAGPGLGAGISSEQKVPDACSGDLELSPPLHTPKCWSWSVKSSSKFGLPAVLAWRAYLFLLQESLFPNYQWWVCSKLYSESNNVRSFAWTFSHISSIRLSLEKTSISQTGWRWRRLNGGSGGWGFRTVS